MTKLDAIRELLREARADKTTNAGAKRATAACKALGLDRVETVDILYHLEICDELGNAKKVQRVW